MIDFKDTNDLHKRLLSLRPLKELDIKRLRDDERTEMIYASNALEGNTLTISETQMILEKGITIDGKSMREHLEVVNLNDAIDYVEDLVRGEEVLDERTLKQIHYLVYKTTGERHLAGNYRTINVKILGSGHLTADFLNIHDEMKSFFEWKESAEKTLHPVEFAAQLHRRFVGIHPFVDANGRTARLLLNFTLTKAGYPPIIIKPDNQSRLDYINALEIAHTTGDDSDFIRLVKGFVDSKMDLMIKQVEASREYQRKIEDTCFETFEKSRSNPI